MMKAALRKKWTDLLSQISETDRRSIESAALQIYVNDGDEAFVEWMNKYEATKMKEGDIPSKENN